MRKNHTRIQITDTLHKYAVPLGSGKRYAIKAIGKTIINVIINVTNPHVAHNLPAISFNIFIPMFYNGKYSCFLFQLCNPFTISSLSDQCRVVQDIRLSSKNDDSRRSPHSPTKAKDAQLSILSVWIHQ